MEVRIAMVVDEYRGWRVTEGEMGYDYISGKKERKK